MNKFGIHEDHYQWIIKILKAFLPESKVFVFGSRSRGDFKKYSDLDLVIESEKPIDFKVWSEIHEHFAESMLPFKIDIIEMTKISPEFKKQIQDDLKLFFISSSE